MIARILFSKALLLAAGFLTLAFVPGEMKAADGNPPQISFGAHKLMETNVEGPDVERTYFTIGENRVVFGLPKGWRLSTGDGFLLLPEEGTVDGEIHVTRSPFTPDFDLATNVLKYRESAAQGMPQGASKEQAQQPLMDPYPFNGWKSLGFVWSYGGQGRAMVRTVSYINLDAKLGVQVIVTTLASKQDSPKIEKAAKDFMASWWVKGK
ncbi:hypothetical protein CfE428DRAFT_4988 [Chthoniobacter flavus Ellin428]|uniref:Lipoprotein n=1 Tax=Chthoniobacter flavus Ellin428 TaxID=497964 RepID=B4D7U8_9BACT|nr:hypothetical protein [Chthoniobacter flavus]EDY17471.1 hypothetical protein CfE428DRAFT_4988 [Chthoniobacter flavus Ellin428]TCO92267.1 hypothetical protein EV701_10636 [Chthoniobacter flavus]